MYMHKYIHVYPYLYMCVYMYIYICIYTHTYAFFFQKNQPEKTMHFRIIITVTSIF